jgi:hypothetical protein
LHLVSDVQLVALAGTALVGFIVQALNLWRTFENGRATKRNERKIGDVSALARDIQEQVHVARRALDAIQKTMDSRGAVNYGRRSTDYNPPTMRPPRPELGP